MIQFKVGNVVKLKSGGCSMTVSEIFNTRVICVWHDNKGTPHENGYAFDLIVLKSS